jgi:hypothetical protein
MSFGRRSEGRKEMKSRRRGTRTWVGFSVGLLILALLPCSSFAAISQKIHYQGYLTDSGGTSVNSSGLLMTFSIYDSPSGGIRLWTEIRTVAVNNGIFNLNLGEFNPVDLPFDASYYLGMSVTGDPEMTPGIPLASVGYAFWAKYAETDHDTMGSLSCSGG